jgi:hypothetical protein
MGEIRRTYQQNISLPSFVRGSCVACNGPIVLNAFALYENNDVHTCHECGAKAPRRRLVRQALANLDVLIWSLFASDLYIQDQVTLNSDDYAVYDLTPLQQVKWHHAEAFPNAISGQRYLANPIFIANTGILAIQDTQAQSPDPNEASESFSQEVTAFWWRFGLRDREAVPAWRQSLQGAATLVYTNPSAALVLIAAGFESFFIETMRIGWLESGLEPAGFERLNRRNLPISNLIEWLSAAVGKRILPNNTALYERWRTLVNQRRNDVVHRAIVHFTPDQARESMAAALECVEFIDDCGLVRPHAYYRRSETQSVNSTADLQEA